jgi:cyclophilin family peptidyl-prolyl cis-trans isomerase
MKKILSALPLTLMLVGCGAPATSGGANDATNNAASSDNAAPAAENVAAENTAPATADAGKPTYKVIDEAQPGMPTALVEGLKKAKVSPPPASLKVPDKARVRLETSKGPVTIELNTKEAPLHARSFYYLAQKGFYNGTSFHRFADLLQGSGKPGNIIQGGDPLSRDAKTQNYAGAGGPGYQVPRERNALKHDRLVIAAARSQDPDSAGSQFYITQNPVYFLDQNDGYTVFGKVVEGADNALNLRKDDTLTKAEIVK